MSRILEGASFFTWKSNRSYPVGPHLATVKFNSFLPLCPENMPSNSGRQRDWRNSDYIQCAHDDSDICAMQYPPQRMGCQCYSQFLISARILRQNSVEIGLLN
jgi:hypothetical protein